MHKRVAKSAAMRFEAMISPTIRFDINLQNYRKPLDSFSPQVERKRSKEYLVIILAVKESLERFSCKKQTPGSRFKT